MMCAVSCSKARRGEEEMRRLREPQHNEEEPVRAESSLQFDFRIMLNMLAVRNKKNQFNFAFSFNSIFI